MAKAGKGIDGMKTGMKAVHERNYGANQMAPQSTTLASVKEISTFENLMNNIKTLREVEYALDNLTARLKNITEDSVSIDRFQYGSVHELFQSADDFQRYTQEMLERIQHISAMFF